MSLKKGGYALYDKAIYDAWDNQTIITMPFFALDAGRFVILGLDYGYDVAELVCVDETYTDCIQSVSFAVLNDLLAGRGIKQAQYRYVNRWFDDAGIPHFHGVYSKYPTIEETQRNIRFELLDVPVDIVYQATDEADMFAYLHDVNRNRDNDDSGEQDENDLSPYGHL